MQFKIPKNTSQYFWTQHALFKMKQYGLSAQRILGIIRNPQRKEEGIVKNTIAVMKPASVKTTAGKPVWKQEIWAMYQKKVKSEKFKTQSLGSRQSHPVKSAEGGAASSQFNGVKIISAWRYPGVSPQNGPIPEEILRELERVK